MAIELQQRVDIRQIAPGRWRLIGLAGRAIFFYGEALSEKAEFPVKSEFGQGDVGKWRAVDDRRHLVVGYGGKAKVFPKPDGGPGEIQVTFDGVILAI